jgi:hypothetical protein
MARRQNQLIRQLERIEGVTVVKGGQGHWKVLFNGRLITTLTGTGKDYGTRRQNELAVLRRAGIRL